MREILFKAKRLDNGEWVEGAYLHQTDYYGEKCDKHYIIDGTETDMEGYGEHYLIDKDTLCQYTGFTDKNGNKIWENDILKGFEYPFCDEGDFNYYAHVVWFDNCPAFGVYTIKNPKSNVRGISEGNTEFMDEWDSEKWEVIGNIFDNPELIGGGE